MKRIVEKNRQLKLVATLFVAFILIAFSSPLRAGEKVKDVPEHGYTAASSAQLTFLKPIDTIVVDDGFGLGGWKIFNFDHRDSRPAILQAVKDEATGNDWITVKADREFSGEALLAELDKPNVAQLTVMLNSREIPGSNGSVIKLGVVTAMLGSRSQGKLFPDPSATEAVPFVISDDKADNLRQVQKAVKILTAHIPGLMRCSRGIQPYKCDVYELRYRETTP